MTSAAADLQPLVAAPLAAFDRTGVRWCLLRGEAVARPGGDVDLLVDPADLPTVRHVLTTEQAFTEVRGWGRWPHHFFVERMPGGRIALKLDIVTELAFGRYAELDSGAGRAVLGRTVRDGAIARPAPDDRFWALLLHVLLDRGALTAAYAEELVSLAPMARRGDSALRQLIDRAYPRRWGSAQIADAIAAGHFEAVLAIAPALRAEWPGAVRPARGARAFVRRGLRYADRRRPSRRASARRPAEQALDDEAVARRADWRFLLPEPRLGRVGYLAPHAPDLVAALKHVSAQLELLEPPTRGGEHQLVVATAGRAASTARTASTLLAPGGHLYAEVPGRRARSWERALRKAGFDEVDLYWLWPNEHACREMVPLEPDAIHAMLERRDPGARARLRARAASILAHSGLFRFAVGRAAVVGRWSG